MADLEDYIEKLIQVQNREQDRAFSREELRRIALDMGVSEEMWERIQDDVNDHIVRGAGFLRYKNWTDAIEEFEQAEVFRPDDMEVLFGLAQSYAGRWSNTSAREDRDAALAYAEKCLELDPGHDPSLKMISQVREGKKVRERKMRAAPWMVLSLLLAVGIVVLLFFFNQRPEQSEKVTQVSDPAVSSAPQTSVPAPDVKTKPPRAAEVVEDSSAGEGLLNDLPMKLSANKRSEGLTLYPDRAKYTRYDESYTLTIAADVVSKRIEIEELKLRLEFIGRDGKPVHIDEKEAWANWRPVVRPGDVIPFEYLDYVESPDFPDIREIHVSVATVTKRPAPAEYEPSKPVEVVWDRKPPNFDLQVRERLSTVRKGYLGREEDITHVLALELVNSGRSAISGLTLRLEYPDGRGANLTSKKVIVNLDSYPRFKPGQRRVFGTHVPIKNAAPGDFKGYKVFVQEVD